MRGTVEVREAALVSFLRVGKCCQQVLAGVAGFNKHGLIQCWDHDQSDQWVVRG